MPFALAQDPPHLPNIIWIVLDTVRWDATSLGGGPNATPVLESLAERGILFTNAHSTYDWTLPSHFGMFTGVEHWNYHYTEDPQFDVPENSLPHHLNLLGYHTLGITANGVLNQRDSQLTFLKPFDVYHDEWMQPDKVARYFADPSAASRVDTLLNRFNAPLTVRNIRILSSEAADILAVSERLLENRPKEKPLFLFINLMEAHDPFFPPEEVYNLAAEPPLLDFYSDLLNRNVPDWETIAEGEQLAWLKSMRPHMLGRWSAAVDLKPEHIDRYRSRYMACVRHLDAELARFMTLFEEQGLAENSIIVIASDHGEAFGEDGFIQHVGLLNTYAYDIMHHVPLIILPEKRPDKPITIDEKVLLHGLPPTFHDILGVQFDTSEIAKDERNSFGDSFLHMMEGHFYRRPKTLHLALQSRVSGLNEIDEEQMRLLEDMGYLGGPVPSATNTPVPDADQPR